MEVVSQVVVSKADSQEASISEVVAMVRVVSQAEASISEVVAMVRVVSQAEASISEVVAMVRAVSQAVASLVVVSLVASLVAAISILNSDLDKLCVLSVLLLVFRCFIYCCLYYLIVPFISPSTVCVG